MSIAPVSSSAAGAVLNPFGLPRFPQTLKSRSNQIRHARYVGTNYDMGDRWVNRYRYDLLVIISDGERLEAYWLPRSRNPLGGTSVQVSLSEDTGPYPTHQRSTDFKDLGLKLLPPPK